MEDRLQRLPLPERAGAAVRKRYLGTVVGDRILAGHDLPDDLDVVAQTCRRPAPRLSVPTLHDLRAGDADADDHPPAASQGIDRHRVHGQRRRRPSGQLDDRGAQLDALRASSQVRERRQCVGAIRLGGPHRVIAERFRLPHEFDRHAQRRGAVEIEAQTELHDRDAMARPIVDVQPSLPVDRFV